MPEERIYSSGREAYFNLNSTWYDPAGSWLDTRRKPFHYVDNTACVTCCNPRSNVPRRGGHNYRCYCYRPCTCTPGGNPRVRCCVHNPSGGPRDYWGRPIGDACDGCTGGHYSHACSDRGSCCGSGGGTVACAQPCATSGGVCAEPGCRPAGRGVCAEPCVTSGRCGSGRGVCAEPGCSPARRSKKNRETWVPRRTNITIRIMSVQTPATAVLRIVETRPCPAKVMMTTKNMEHRIIKGGLIINTTRSAINHS
ncbi:uncharacterized protein M6D78_016316 [Vipera latastei]